MGQYAFHIPLSDDRLTALVERWLSSYGLRITHSGDVYAAAVQLVRLQSDPPLVVAIGTDWLLDSEFAIFDYVRATWKEAVVLAYGARASMAPPDPSGRTLRCTSERALTSLILESPETLAARLVAPPRFPAAEARFGRDALHSGATSEPVSAFRPERSTPQTEQALLDRARSLEGVDLRGVQPKAALTPAEWSALLDEIDL